MKKEENALIAEFMGAVIKSHPSLREGHMCYFFDTPPTKHSSYYWDSDNMEYSIRWDWLIPVWNKIAKWGWDNHANYWKQNIGRDEISINNFLDFSVSKPVMYGEITIEAVYEVVLAFINYYDSLEHHTDKPFKPLNNEKSH